MTRDELSVIGAVVVFFAVLIYYVRRMLRGENEVTKRWETEAADNPFDFMADDEFVFIKYKDEVFPMTKLEKIERWDAWNRKEKREFYFTIKRNITKGRAKWVTTADGNRMYVEFKQKREFLVERYNKISRNFERRFPEVKRQQDKNRRLAKQKI